MRTAQADASGNGYLESAEVGRILARMRGGARGVSAGEVRRIMRQVRTVNPLKMYIPYRTLYYPTLPYSNNMHAWGQAVHALVLCLPSLLPPQSASCNALGTDRV